MDGNFRWERIEKLFTELRYEIERGMMEGEIDESIGYTFIVPISRAIPNGVIHCEFRSRPVQHYMAIGGMEPYGPKLRVIDGGRK